MRERRKRACKCRMSRFEQQLAWFKLYRIGLEWEWKKKSIRFNLCIKFRFIIWVCTSDAARICNTWRKRKTITKSRIIIILILCDKRRVKDIYNRLDNIYNVHIDKKEKTYTVLRCWVRGASERAVHTKTDKYPIEQKKTKKWEEKRESGEKYVLVLKN